MRKFLEIGLGIVAALGGFVDIGDLVFATQAGAKYGLRLLWALALGTLLIMIYAEMSGRVATVAKRSVFVIIRQRFPKKIDFSVLMASTMVNILTCAAEIGGVALVLQLLSDLPYRALIAAVGLALVLIIWILPFQAIEKIFGYLGLGLLVLVVAALKTHPDWHAAGAGLLPHLSAYSTANYWYYAVGIIAATLMPYEVYFYASGAIEEKWKPSELIVNKVNAVLGFGLGGLMVAGIIAVSANLFAGPQINPEFINTAALAALIPFGKAALLLVLLGMLFTITGAAIETCFAGAYNISQYYGWKWGKHHNPLSVPRFTITWIVILIVATLIIMTGFDPITVTEYAVIFSVVVMPLTYLPILLVAEDENIMGRYKNKPWNTALGWVGLAIITLVSLAAIPLMIITQRGSL
jgi:manganese transport protein